MDLIITIIRLTLVAFIIILMYLWLYYTLIITHSTAPFVPSNRRKMKKVFAKYIKPGNKFLDIGSGDGRMVALASDLGAEAYGIEINPFLKVISTIALKAIGKKNFKIIRGNMFKHDYSRYDIIYTYLLPDTMDRILPQIQDSLSKEQEVLVISNYFIFKGIEPVESLERGINIYRIIKNAS